MCITILTIVPQEISSHVSPMNSTAQVDPMPQDWRLHLGVHKTATTHIQELLKAAQGSLAEVGTDVVPMEVLRKERIPDLRLRNPHALLGGSLLRGQLTRALAPHLTGKSTLVMSNEDWMGASEEALAPVTYPKASRRLGAFLSAVPRHASMHLFLAVRRWDAFLPAAYSTAIKNLELPFAFEAVRARVMAETPDWSDVVARVLRAAPRAELTVWPYESYRAKGTEIFSAITGHSFEVLPDLPPPVATRTPTQAAISAIEALPKGLSRGERRKRTFEIWEETDPAKDGKFAPFSEADQTVLAARYTQQLEIIAALPRVRFL